MSTCAYCTNAALPDLTYCGRLFCYARWFHVDREEEPLSMDLSAFLTMHTAMAEDDTVSAFYTDAEIDEYLKLDTPETK